MKALIVLLGVVALVALVFAISTSLWACAFMLIAWLVSYPLSWAYAYAAAIVVCLIVGAVRKAA